MNGKSLEIVCSKCGADTLLKREPVYEGFKKVGEKLTCASCGHQASVALINALRYLSASVQSDAEGQPITVASLQKTDAIRCTQCDGVMTYQTNKLGMSAEQKNKMREAFLEQVSEDPQLKHYDVERLWATVNRSIDVSEMDVSFKKMPKKDRPRYGE